MKKLLQVAVTLLPWPLRRRLLVWLFHFEIHPTSRIGLSFVYPDRLVLAAHARIGHLTVAKGLSLLEMGEHSSIGNLNWITGFSLGAGSRHFAHEADRRPELLVGTHAAITNRHLLDCTNRVRIGAFTTFAGFGSQILTHSIDLQKSRQSSAPVSIGEYCFVGTNCVLLAGAALPDRSVLGAKSLLTKAFTDAGTLYGGVPAKAIQPIPSDAAYFSRQEGFVY